MLSSGKVQLSGKNIVNISCLYKYKLLIQLNLTWFCSWLLFRWLKYLVSCPPPLTPDYFDKNRIFSLGYSYLNFQWKYLMNYRQVIVVYSDENSEHIQNCEIIPAYKVCLKLTWHEVAGDSRATCVGCDIYTAHIESESTWYTRIIGLCILSCSFRVNNKSKPTIKYVTEQL